MTEIETLKKKHIKRFEEHPYKVEIEQKTKLIPKLLEIREICQKVSNTNTPDRAEKALNKKTGFVNTRLSYEALGFENEYQRIQQLDREINGQLNLSDITEAGRLKKKVEDGIREKYITYYTAEEYAQKEIVERIVEEFNQIPFELRRKFIFHKHELKKNPFATI